GSDGIGGFVRQPSEYRPVKHGKLRKSWDWDDPDDAGRMGRAVFDPSSRLTGLQRRPALLSACRVAF
ncbi:MAG: hypothetical protein ACRELG_16980, partial [Gemmataceae bacterium]